MTERRGLYNWHCRWLHMEQQFASICTFDKNPLVNTCMTHRKTRITGHGHLSSRELRAQIGGRTYQVTEHDNNLLCLSFMCLFFVISRNWTKPRKWNSFGGWKMKSRAREPEADSSSDGSPAFWSESILRAILKCASSWKNKHVKLWMAHKSPRAKERSEYISNENSEIIFAAFQTSAAPAAAAANTTSRKKFNKVCPWRFDLVCVRRLSVRCLQSLHVENTREQTWEQENTRVCCESLV